MIRIGNKVVAGSADVDLSTVLKSLNKTGLSVWIGTQTEHDALAESVKNNEKTTFITYDTDEDIYLIIDTIISYGKTWSSVKISSELAKKINASDIANVVESGNMNPVSSNAVATVAENINTTFLSKDYVKAINDSPYTKIGVSAGVTPGYFRLYNKPKKIVVIGNSITQHGYLEADGIEWTVPDMREMAASHPDSGWVTLIKKYLTEGLGLTDCHIYKCNGSAWEKGTSGSRTIDLITPQTAYEVLTTGVDLTSQTTLGNVLTEDVDLILIQLSENMAEPTTDALRRTDSTDWANLYTALNARCPNAQIYQFMGFWTNLNKFHVMAGCVVNPVFAPVLIEPSIFTNTFSQINYKAAAGDNIYDANNNVIATVSSAVAGHPNDTGFLVMAMQFLDALFNNRAVSNQKDVRAIYVPRNNGSTITATVFKPVIVKELIKDRSTSGAETAITYANFEENYSWLNYFVFGGIYPATLFYPSNGAKHGFLRITNNTGSVDTNSARDGSGYNACLQELIPTNQMSYYSKFHRTVQLAASGTTFNPWYNNDQNYYEEQLVISEATTLVDNDWIYIGTLAHRPSIAIDAYYILPAGSSIINDFSKGSGFYRARINLSNATTRVNAAAPGGTVSLSLPANTILVVKYK